MKRKAFGAVILLVALASARALPAQTPEPLSQLLVEWQAAFNAGDAAAAAALYTKDAVRMPPDEPLVRGREEIAASMAQYGGWTIELKAWGGLLEGSVGTTWGTYKLSGMVEDAPTTIEGRWMNAVKKTDDGWRVYRDIWNPGPTE